MKYDVYKYPRWKAIAHRPGYYDYEFIIVAKTRFSAYLLAKTWPEVFGIPEKYEVTWVGDKIDL